MRTTTTTARQHRVPEPPDMHLAMCRESGLRGSKMTTQMCCVSALHDWRDHRGELRLAFLYWASYDLDGKLIKGQCVHPVTGGNGPSAVRAVC